MARKVTVVFTIDDDTAEDYERDMAAIMELGGEVIDEQDV